MTPSLLPEKLSVKISAQNIHLRRKNFFGENCIDRMFARCCEQKTVMSGTQLDKVIVQLGTMLVKIGQVRFENKLRIIGYKGNCV